MAKHCEGFFRGFIAKNGTIYPPEQLPDRVKKVLIHTIIQMDERRSGRIKYSSFHKM